MPLTDPQDPRVELMEMVENGMIRPSYVIQACLQYMSVDDVKEMCHANDIFLPSEMEGFYE